MVEPEVVSVLFNTQHIVRIVRIEGDDSVDANLAEESRFHMYCHDSAAALRCTCLFHAHRV